ncbi:MAG: DNA-protecting protein DprA [Candidatus Margulisbacteria bacterium]|nr:DNA-protecting protein DprA [Candidatus Margulisiibacteriota bacterium]MBU1956014.1 DNA-protecting protein DprA [Candidatus Margulisiibacteriota bacterium]
MLAGFVGSRSLPASFSPLVSSLVASFLARGFQVASGGAVGADQFALSALVEQGVSASGVVFSAWASASGFPVSVRPTVGCFQASGGQVVWGSASVGAPRQQVVSALLGRNQRLVSVCSCLVAFLYGPSRCSLYTVRQAVRRGIPVYVFFCGGGAVLPADLAPHCFVLQKEVV